MRRPGTLGSVGDFRASRAASRARNLAFASQIKEMAMMSQRADAAPRAGPTP
jgi:hypothetical protein